MIVTFHTEDIAEWLTLGLTAGRACQQKNALPDWKVDIQCRCHAMIAIHMYWGIVWAAGIKQNELTSQLEAALLELNDDGNMRLGMVVQTT